MKKYTFIELTKDKFMIEGSNNVIVAKKDIKDLKLVDGKWEGTLIKDEPKPRKRIDDGAGVVEETANADRVDSKPKR